MGWVLSEIDSLNLHKQVLGVEGPGQGRAKPCDRGWVTSGDAARPLGWSRREGREA